MQMTMIDGSRDQRVAREIDRLAIVGLKNPHVSDQHLRQILETAFLYTLGSGLVDHSQKMTVAARAMAEKKAVGQRS